MRSATRGAPDRSSVRHLPAGPLHKGATARPNPLGPGQRSWRGSRAWALGGEAGRGCRTLGPGDRRCAAHSGGRRSHQQRPVGQADEGAPQLPAQPPASRPGQAGRAAGRPRETRPLPVPPTRTLLGSVTSRPLRLKVTPSSERSSIAPSSPDSRRQAWVKFARCTGVRSSPYPAGSRLWRASRSPPPQGGDGGRHQLVRREPIHEAREGLRTLRSHPAARHRGERALTRCYHRVSGVLQVLPCLPWWSGSPCGRPSAPGGRGILSTHRLEGRGPQQVHQGTHAPPGAPVQQVGVLFQRARTSVHQDQ